MVPRVGGSNPLSHPEKTRFSDSTGRVGHTVGHQHGHTDPWVAAAVGRFRLPAIRRGLVTPRGVDRKPPPEWIATCASSLARRPSVRNCHHGNGPGGGSCPDDPSGCRLPSTLGVGDVRPSRRRHRDRRHRRPGDRSCRRRQGGSDRDFRRFKRRGSRSDDRRTDPPSGRSQPGNAAVVPV